MFVQCLLGGSADFSPGYSIFGIHSRGLHWIVPCEQGFAFLQQRQPRSRCQGESKPLPHTWFLGTSGQVCMWLSAVALHQRQSQCPLPGGWR